MMKIFSLLIFFFALAAAQSPSRILQILRLLSSECSNHGYLWKGQCFCVTTYTGPTCSQKSKIHFFLYKMTVIKPKRELKFLMIHPPNVMI